jgi:hypothetical protein
MAKVGVLTLGSCLKSRNMLVNCWALALRITEIQKEVEFRKHASKGDGAAAGKVNQQKGAVDVGRDNVGMG